jgi:hypothetical protein
VRTLLPDRQEKMLRGGRVFSVGLYFSPRYAEFVCQKYIGLGLFSTVHSGDAEDAVVSAVAGVGPAEAE